MRARRLMVTAALVALATMTSGCSGDASSSTDAVVVTEDPLIRSPIKDITLPEAWIKSVLHLRGHHCLEVDDMVPVVRPTTVWEPAAQQLVYDYGGNYTVGHLIEGPGMPLELSDDLSDVLSARAIRQARACAEHLDDTRAVVLFGPPAM